MSVEHQNSLAALLKNPLSENRTSETSSSLVGTADCSSNRDNGLGSRDSHSVKEVNQKILAVLETTAASDEESLLSKFRFYKTDDPSDLVVDLPLVSSKAAVILGRLQFLSDCRTSIPLIIVDSAAVFLAESVSGLTGVVVPHATDFHSTFFTIAIILFTLVVHHIHGLYPGVGLGQSIEFRRILRTVLIVSLASGVSLVASPIQNLSPLVSFLVFSLGLILLLPLSRATARIILGRFNWWTQSVLVVGDGAKAESVFQNLSRSSQEGLRPVGIVYDATNHWVGDANGARVYLGPTSAIEQILLAMRTSRVVIASADAMQDFHFGHYCNIPHVSLQAPWSNHPTEKATLVERNGTAEIHCFQRGLSPSALIAKRVMDVFLILCCSPLFIPMFATIACLIKLSSKGPVFYGQARLGKNGKSFRIWKFRSMVPNADTVLQKYLINHPELQDEWSHNHKLKNDPRITSIGHLLRKTSLDELPQLWNVLVGEMSLVGPRPIIDHDQYDRKYVENHPDVFALYTSVRPGITGLWQISGRNDLSYLHRIACDREYIQNWSCMSDVYILWRTIKTAILREGAY